MLDINKSDQKSDNRLFDTPHTKLDTYVCFWQGRSADTSACMHWPSCNCNKLQHSMQY